VPSIMLLLCSLSLVCVAFSFRCRTIVLFINDVKYCREPYGKELDAELFL